MLIGSILLHVVLLGSLLGVFYFPQEVVVTSTPIEQPQFVELYENSELPEDLPAPEIEEEAAEEVPEPELVAFQVLSSIVAKPSPTPSLRPSPTAPPTVQPTPTSTPTPTPTAWPTSTPTPRKAFTPLPRFNWTPKPRPIPRGTVKPAIRLEPFPIPKREGVLEAGTPRIIATPVESSGQQQHFLRSPSSGSTVILDQEDAFPFPEYLMHVEEKIAGLWFPQGSGTVEIHLQIGRNGKILKSGVDKGMGLGVDKLQDSVVRALGMVKHFEPLPVAYNGNSLRIRIIVKR
jgi:hypothetical protein